MEFRCAGITSGTCNGIGISLEVWFQGCSRGCAGCQNPDLQLPDNGFFCDTDTVINHLNKYFGFYNSVVYLGGDPVDQSKPLYTMASNSNLPNILYTGWLFEDIPPDIKSVMDVIVDGPYVQELKVDGFPVTSNQRIFIKNSGTFSQTFSDFRRTYNANKDNFFRNI